MIEAGNLSGASWWAAAAVSPGQRPISGLATPSRGPKRPHPREFSFSDASFQIADTSTRMAAG